MEKSTVWKRISVCLNILSLGIAAVALNGCAYLHNRANDASDCIELGLTVSSKPGIALFTDCYSVLPIGYSHVDGKILGWGNRQAGFMPFEHKCWGVLAVGSYMQGLGELDTRDPHVARRDQIDITEWPRYDLGIVNLVRRKNWRSFPAFFECDKSFHLGWIGIHLKYRVLDLVDFVVGWTTIDFMKDDLITKDRK